VTNLKIIYFGSPYYSIPLLKKIISSGHQVPLVISQGSKKTRRGKRVHTAIYDFCEKNKLRCITPDQFSDAVVDDISSIEADLGIVYAYGKIIPQSVIDATEFGIMNLHCSLLPAYRGAAPIQHALINNETTTGVTYFEINEKLDEGKMILSKVYTIKESDNCTTIQDNLTEIAVECCSEAIDKMSAKDYIQSTLVKKPTYAKKIIKEDAFLNWDMNVRLMFNTIRALHLWPVARIDLFGDNIKILNANCIVKKHEHPTGTVVSFNKNELIIAAKEGYLSILKLQLEGKKTITNRDLYNSNHSIRETLINNCANISYKSL
jgi:methionyl-tRNA formyltransferase